MKSLRPYVVIGIAMILISCKKDDPVLSGEAPTLTVTAAILNTGPLSHNGQVTATDTVDFFIDVSAPVGFNAVLIGGSGNTIISKAQAGVGDGVLLVEDIPYRVLTTSDDDGASASYIFVAEDELGQRSDTTRFSFTIQ